MKNGLIINTFGTKLYYLNNKFHRENLPAIEYANGDKSYFVHGKYHREDGPAIANSNGFKSYYLNNIRFSEEDYWKEIKRRKSLNYILLNLKKELSNE